LKLEFESNFEHERRIVQRLSKELSVLPEVGRGKRRFDAHS
jgi:hypothetical protein